MLAPSVSDSTITLAPSGSHEKLPPHGLEASRVAIPKPRLEAAPVQEVFSSIQGEGSLVGRRQLFVRFAHCHLHCAYCDTPMTTPNGQPLWEPQPASGEWERPASADASGCLSPTALLGLLDSLRQAAPVHSVSFTGGEPLLQTPFLTQALPLLQTHGFATYLETSGTQPQLLAPLLPFLDYVSMDVKLPSTTLQAPRWQEHQAFYALARQQVGDDRVWLKCVVSEQTPAEELLHLLPILAGGRSTVFLQPQSPISNAQPAALISNRHLLDLEATLHRSGVSVAVVPQMHKFLNLD